jgi:preprotein translocase subunit SecE
MVFIFVVMACIFFFVADQLLSLGISYLLGVGR